METSQKEIMKEKPLELPVTFDAKKPELQLKSGQQILYVTEVNVPITPTEEKTVFDVNKDKDDDDVNSDYDNMDDLIESESFSQNESVNNTETTSFEKEAEKIPQQEPETLDECVELAQQTLEMVNNMEQPAGNDTKPEPGQPEVEEKGSLEEEFEAELNMEQTTVSVIAKDQEEVKQEVQEIGSLEEEFEAQLKASMTEVEEEAIADQQTTLQMIAPTAEVPEQAAEQEALPNEEELLSKEASSSQLAEPLPPVTVQEVVEVVEMQQTQQACISDQSDAVESAPKQAVISDELKMDIANKQSDDGKDSTPKVSEKQVSSIADDEKVVVEPQITASKVSEKHLSPIADDEKVVVESQILASDQPVSEAAAAEDFIPEKTNKAADNSSNRPEVNVSPSLIVTNPIVRRTSPSPDRTNEVLRRVIKVNKEKTKEERQSAASLIPEHIRKEYEEAQERKRRELELANEPMNIYLVIGGAVVMMTAIILMFAYSLGVTG